MVHVLPCHTVRIRLRQQHRDAFSPRSSERKYFCACERTCTAGLGALTYNANPNRPTWSAVLLGMALAIAVHSPRPYSSSFARNVSCSSAVQYLDPAGVRSWASGFVMAGSGLLTAFCRLNRGFSLLRVLPSSSGECGLDLFILHRCGLTQVFKESDCSTKSV